MSRVAFYFVACLMALTTVASMKRKQSLPAALTNIGAQCRSRGPFVGACLNQNMVNAELACGSLKCAQPRPNHLYDAVDIGIVYNGTPCGPDKACSNGNCVQTGARSRTSGDWLVRAGLTIQEGFTCITPLVPPPLSNFGQPMEAHPPAPKRRI